MGGVDARVDRFRRALQYTLRHAGLPTVYTSGFRTHEQQAALYEDWLAGRRKLPAAPPGHSKHERGLAFDLSAPPETLAIAGRLAEHFGFRWGGYFATPDPVHFEAA